MAQEGKKGFRSCIASLLRKASAILAPDDSVPPADPAETELSQGQANDAHDSRFDGEDKMDLTNLDALIAREDFAVPTTHNASQLSSTIQIRDLEHGAFFLNALRKPDFQRETNEWDAKKIAEFVQSFVQGELIPAIILWSSGNLTFVIDGAHRLSALIAWVNDDYGDGVFSKGLYGERLNDEQINVAKETRQRVESIIGSYRMYKEAASPSRPAVVEAKTMDIALKLGFLGLQLQWVKGDSSVAERSFFNINQKSAPINNTELRLLMHRRKPNAIAARAISRAGTGHKYWATFATENQQTIESDAKEISQLLFTPPLHSPVKSLDLPIAGKSLSTQSLPLIFELINVVNSVRKDSDLADDSDGSTTNHFVHNTLKLVRRLTGLHPSSLGLHPAVYFYSTAGRFQPTAFLAIASLVHDLSQGAVGLKRFIERRKSFETFLLDYKHFSMQVVWKHGSGMKGFRPMKHFFEAALEFADKQPDEIAEAIQALNEFGYLTGITEAKNRRSRDFDSDTKSAVFLRDAVKAATRCTICSGLLHRNSISIDHVKRRQEGGAGTLENGQLTHPYCNSTVKN